MSDQVDIQNLYVNFTEDLRFAKRQQWQLAYYVLLIDAGLVGLYALFKANCQATQIAAWFFTAAALATAMAGWWLLWRFERWLEKTRKGLKCIEEHHATADFRSTARHVRSGRKLDTRWGRDPEVLISVVGTEFVAAIIIIIWFWLSVN